MQQLPAAEVRTKPPYPGLPSAADLKIIIPAAAVPSLPEDSPTTARAMERRASCPVTSTWSGASGRSLSVDPTTFRRVAAIKGLLEELQDREVRLALQNLATQSLHAQVTAQQQQIGDLAAGQLQLQKMAAVLASMQKELASVRKERDVAFVAR